MSLLIATPCYGGMVFEPYFLSCLALREFLYFNSVAHSWVTTRNESLITRARDTSVAAFMKTDFERLLFIDADTDFKPEDVGKLWGLDADIACGPYRMKSEGAPYAVWLDGEQITELPLEARSVDYAGTGFMMIKREVFEKLVRPAWRYREDGDVVAYFQDPIEDGIKLSEDFFFCKRAREAGFRIVLEPSIELGHWGLKRYV